MPLIDKLNQALDKREADNNLRSMSLYDPDSELIDFYSNDYLGLARNQELFTNISQRHESIPFNGSTGSRLLSGNNQLYAQTEEQLAVIFSGESALIFNSGYVANLAILSSVPKKGDTILYDELSHASIKDGLRLSLARHFKFRHNDLDDLEKKLRRSEGDIFILVESVYSMDGDYCPLPELVSLAEQYKAQIILDEAHTTGLMGEQGGGLSETTQLQNHIFARIYTFGKAMGIHGACIVGDQLLKKYLINFARPFIYTTSLPAHSIIAIEQSFKYLHQHLELQEQLRKKVSHFNEKFEEVLSMKYQKIESKHPIQSIIIPGNEPVKAIASKLNENGYGVLPILYPTVPKGKERLRVCLHTFNDYHDISHLIDTLASLK
ncbi:MAG: pyridoxal phosphate-dependent aminotransferase family protein [Fulvivirga sp.]|nr:pyridoxal phosphate-dependent aminotransferase family protein [Fulvivirga sp.]